MSSISYHLSTDAGLPWEGVRREELYRADIKNAEIEDFDLALKASDEHDHTSLPASTFADELDLEKEEMLLLAPSADVFESYDVHRSKITNLAKMVLHAEDAEVEAAIHHDLAKRFDKEKVFLAEIFDSAMPISETKAKPELKEKEADEVAIKTHLLVKAKRRRSTEFSSGEIENSFNKENEANYDHFLYKKSHVLALPSKSESQKSTCDKLDKLIREKIKGNVNKKLHKIIDLLLNTESELGKALKAQALAAGLNEFIEKVENFKEPTLDEVDDSELKLENKINLSKKHISILFEVFENYRKNILGIYVEGLWIAEILEAHIKDFKKSMDIDWKMACTILFKDGWKTFIEGHWIKDDEAQKTICQALNLSSLKKIFEVKLKEIEAPLKESLVGVHDTLENEKQLVPQTKHYIDVLLSYVNKMDFEKECVDRKAFFKFIKNYVNLTNEHVSLVFKALEKHKKGLWVRDILAGEISTYDPSAEVNWQDGCILLLKSKWNKFARCEWIQHKDTRDLIYARLKECNQAGCCKNKEEKLRKTALKTKLQVGSNISNICKDIHKNLQCAGKAKFLTFHYIGNLQSYLKNSCFSKKEIIKLEKERLLASLLADKDTKLFLEVFKKEYSQLSADAFNELTGEYLKHSFSRLPLLYECHMLFCNSVKHLINNFADDKTQQNILHVAKNYIMFSAEQASKLKEETSKLDELHASKYYRKTQGKKPAALKRSIKAEELKFLDKVKLALSDKKLKLLKKTEASHIMVAPGLFSWNADKLAQDIAKLFSSAPLDAHRVYLKKQFFEEGKKNIQKLLKFLKESSESDAEFILSALLAISEYVLTLGSKTTGMPPFINHRMDAYMESLLSKAEVAKSDATLTVGTDKLREAKDFKILLAHSLIQFLEKTLQSGEEIQGRLFKQEYAFYIERIEQTIKSRIEAILQKNTTELSLLELYELRLLCDLWNATTAFKASLFSDKGSDESTAKAEEVVKVLFERLT